MPNVLSDDAHPSVQIAAADVYEHPDSSRLLILSLVAFFCCGLVGVYTFVKCHAVRSQGLADNKIDAAFYLSIVSVVFLVVNMILFGIAVWIFSR